MALLEEMMKNTPLLSGQAREDLRKSFRRTTKKSAHSVGPYPPPPEHAVITTDCILTTVID